MTDACDYALRAVLICKNTLMVNDQLHSFRARSTHQSVITQCGKKSFLPLFGPSSTFVPYLLNHQFLVKSDNKPSTQLIHNSALKLSSSATNRVIRWILSIQGYSFKIEHQAGKTNVVADALSRFATHTNVIPEDQETAYIFAKFKHFHKPMICFDNCCTKHTTNTLSARTF